MLYPLQFEPLLKERVWGGRRLETLYGKPLPPDRLIGESWEIADREEEASRIRNGPLAGRTLRWLMEEHREALLGKSHGATARFPLLLKILDAREKLSLQVHPPAEAASRLGGEPKTEMWYITATEPGATLYAGLRRGVTRELFERKLAEGTVAECFHEITVSPGDALFLPSGRVHAIGQGIVLFEVQQNSDTTYRVFDWNRPGLDGRPRPLHVPEALASIDFEDCEPSLIQSAYSRSAAVAIRYLVHSPLFSVDACRVRKGERFYLRSQTLHILAVVEGRLRLRHEREELLLEPGGFALLPASLERVSLTAETKVEVLLIQCGGPEAEPRRRSSG